MMLRTRAHNASAWLLGLGASLGTACESPKRLPPIANPRSVAEVATRDKNWSVAAARWHEVYLAEGDKTSEPCVQTARALLMLKDPTSAVHMASMGLERFPNDVELLEIKGEALLQRGFRRAAEECYVSLIALDPKRVSSLLALARLRIELRREAQAIPLLKDAVQLTGGDAESYALLARALSATGDACGAFDAYEKLFLTRDGTVEELVAASSLSLEGTLCRVQPDARLICERWLQRAIEIDPQCTRAHFGLGVLYEELGRTKDAIASYRRAVATDPSCLMALTNLAVLYSSLGDTENTLEMVTRALKLETDGARRKALTRLTEPLETKKLAPQPDRAAQSPEEPDEIRQPEGG